MALVENPGESGVSCKTLAEFPNTLFYPHQLSDGSLRFICLTALLLKFSPPSTVIIDEPGLGLHPCAIEVLAGLLREASSRCQVIISTTTTSPCCR
jgi:predicted ATPase